MSAGADRPHLPEGLERSIRAELARLGAAEPGGGLGGLVERWPGAVGEAIARHAWPARIARDGTLVVHASSSAWAYELTQLEATIRERLGAGAPSLRFVVGPLPAAGAEEPSEARAGRVEATPEEVAEAAALTRAITDPDLRDAVARAAAASLARARVQPAPPGSSGNMDYT